MKFHFIFNPIKINAVFLELRLYQKDANVSSSSKSTNSLQFVMPDVSVFTLLVHLYPNSAEKIIYGILNY